MQYAMDYVRRALSDATLEAPDSDKAGKWNETLNSLYLPHKAGGIAAAKTAWQTIKRLNPDAAALETDESKVIHADALGSLTQPAYMLTEYPIYSQGFNLIAGASGSGKSFVALDIAGRIASGKRPVVYIAGEGLAGYAARWFAWKHHNHMLDRAELYFYKEALQVLEQDELDRFIAEIGQYKPALVIVDTLARSAVGMDENSNRDMGQFVAACARLQTTLGVAVIVVHHTGKSGAIRGATALYGAADSVIFVRRDDGIIKLINDNDRGGKNKYSDSAPDGDYLIHPVTAEDHRGNVYEGAVLVKAELNRVGNELSDNHKLVLATVKQHGAMKAGELAEATDLGKATVYRLLGQLTERGLLTKSEGGNYALADGGKSDE
jgi:KaiC/GvpD/RAD55 family RecA-like ATPase